MKKVLLAAVMLVLVSVAGATPVLFEAYQEGTISIPTKESDELTVVEVSFSLDSTCYVQFAVGGNVRLARLWLKSDEDSLPVGALCAGSSFFESFNMTYIYLLNSGEHSISLWLGNYHNQYDPTTCKNGYLQALIFLPDTATAIAEQPISDAEPSTNTPSLISQGPYVNVAGATELVDATGRVIENAITEDKVYISNLPTGTYFARDEDRTIVKIVKVQ